MLDVQEILREIAIFAFPVLLAVTLHEGAHGYVADRLGDPTPRLAGRLTLNPLAHLDLVGTLVFLVTRIIGWAKPVPIDPRHFKNPRRGLLWVSLAGPLANFGLAVAMALCYRLLVSIPFSHGSGVGVRLIFPLTLMAEAGVVVNLGLGVFNLVPVPPLDGSRILGGLLPLTAARGLDRLEKYGFLILLVLIFTGVTDHTVLPVIRTAAHVLLGP